MSKTVTICLFVLTQYTGILDRWTDGETERIGKTISRFCWRAIKMIGYQAEKEVWYL